MSRQTNASDFGTRTRAQGRWWITCAWVTCAAGLQTAEAAMRLKVNVVIERKVDSSTQDSTLVKAWGTLVPTIEKDAAKLVATKIGPMFRSWDFDAAPSRSIETLRLRFVEFADAPQIVVLQLQHFPDGHPEQADELLRIEWVHPGDVALGAVPTRTQAAQAIAAKMSSLEAANVRRIQDWLQKDVPIGAGGKWLGQPVPPTLADLRLAAALPVDRFTELTNAKLLVRCTPPANTVTTPIDLDMQGTNEQQPLEIGANTLPVVLLRPAWVNGVAPAMESLVGYRIGVIYLKEPGRADIEGFFNVQ